MADGQGQQGNEGRVEDELKEEDKSRKETFKELMVAVLYDYNHSIKKFGVDVRGVSKYSINKVRDMREKRRQQKLLAPDMSMLIHDVNQGAGSEVLTHFKQAWSDIHQASQDNSKRIDSMYQTLQDLYGTMANAHQIVSLATDEFGELEKVLENISITEEKIADVEKSFREIEESILECVKTGERLDTERKKHSLKIQLQRHKEERENELHKWEVVVKDEKKLTLDMQEQIERAANKERQEALEGMFMQQMTEYKEKGSIEKPIISEEAARDRTLSQKSVDNVDIVDEDGDEQLQEFLHDDDSKQNQEDVPQSSEGDVPPNDD